MKTIFELEIGLHLLVIVNVPNPTMDSTVTVISTSTVPFDFRVTPCDTLELEKIGTQAPNKFIFKVWSATVWVSHWVHDPILFQAKVW